VFELLLQVTDLASPVILQRRTPDKPSVMYSLSGSTSTVSTAER